MPDSEKPSPDIVDSGPPEYQTQKRDQFVQVLARAISQRNELMNLESQKTTEGKQTDGPDIADVTRRLAIWVFTRSVACALFYFVVMLVETNEPFPFGPDYRLAAQFTVLVTPLAALLLAGRAFLHLQRILADRAGVTLSYWLGRRLRAGLLNGMLP